MATIRIDVDELTGKQLLRAVYEQQVQTIKQLKDLEESMASLKESVDELKGAVDGVAQRLLPRVEALEAALASTEASLSDALADDDAAAAVLAEATQATADIRTEVDRLNALGADPETPVDPDPETPVDPPVVDEDPTV